MARIDKPAAQFQAACKGARRQGLQHIPLWPQDPGFDDGYTHYDVFAERLVTLNNSGEIEREAPLEHHEAT